MEKFLLAFMAFAFFASPADAYAMHITEGILPVGWAAFYFALAAPFVFLGLYKLRRLPAGGGGMKPLLGMVAAAVFVISCMPIPVPTAGTCSHPAGTGIAAILVGPLFGVLSSAVALILQALFLAHGGVSTWGANVLSMGVAGSFAGYLVYVGARRLGASVGVCAFLAGVAADWATYAATSFVMAGALHAPGGFLSLFYAIMLAFVPTQLPLGILEGFMTAGAVKFLYSRRPEIFTSALFSPGTRPGAGGGVGAL